ncbi:MAG: hypothetical protein ACPG5B_01580 [Chitinophagales bacterium]
MEIIPYLWNENLNLKKEKYIWFQKEAHMLATNEGKTSCYLLSKVEIYEGNTKKITLYDEKGIIENVHKIYMKNDFCEIYKLESGHEGTKHYDENENLISEIWVNPNGTKEERYFFFKDNKLVKIIEKDVEDTYTEVLKYNNNGSLQQILSLNTIGKILMERKMIYDNEGKILETQRIQNGTINKSVFYKYNTDNKLLKKEEEKINRLSERKMPPEIFEYEYHQNGVLKEKRWIIYKDENRIDKKYEAISVYNELGLEIKKSGKHYIKNWEETTIYTYKMSALGYSISSFIK